MASHAKSSEKQKKTQQNLPKDPLGHQIRFKTIEKGVGLPCVDFKNRSTGQGSEDRSEPSFMFASNGIHTKSIVDNLQCHGLGRSPSASQVSIRRLMKRSLEEHPLKLS